MTFHQASPFSGFDPVFSGSCDERFRSFWFPPDHQRSFCSYPPNLASASSQNADLDYYHISGRNVPYSSFAGAFCHQLPYANHTLVSSRIPSNSWANINSSETHVSPYPEYCGQFINNSVPDYYNVQRGLTLSDPVYPGFLQLDREYHSGYNAGFNSGLSQPLCGNGFVNSGSAMVSPSQMQLQHPVCQQPTYQHPAYPFQHTEVADGRIGDRFPVSHNYSVDGIMRNSLASSTKLAGENRNFRRTEIVDDGIGGRFPGSHNYTVDNIMQNTPASSVRLAGESRNAVDIQPSIPDENKIQLPIFSPCSPPKQLYAPGWNFEANCSVDMFSNHGVIDYSGVNKPEAISPQSLAEISSFLSPRQMPTDFAVSNCLGNSNLHTDCKFLTSCAMISSVNEAQVNHVTTVSTSLHHAMPEIPKPNDKEHVTYAPSINTPDKHTMGTEYTWCGRVPSYSVTGISSGVADGTNGCEIAVNDNEEDGISDVESLTSCVESGDDIMLDISAASSAMDFGSWQTQAQTGEETRSISATTSAAVIPSQTSVDSGYAARSRELIPEVTETPESHAVTCDSDNTISYDSDDVIVLSPLPIAHKSATPISTNAGTNTVESYCHKMQPACQIADDCRLQSVLDPIVPNSLPVTFCHVGSHTVPHCVSSLSAPLTSHEVSNCGSQITDDRGLQSALDPVVPNSLPATFSPVGSHTVTHCISSPSVPLTSHDLSECGSRDVFPTPAKRIVDHSYSVLAASSERRLTRQASSRLCTNSQRSSANGTCCNSVTLMARRTPTAAVRVPLQPLRRYSTELQRLLNLSNSSRKDELLEPRTYNPAVGGNGCRNMLENVRQRTRLQTLTLSRPVPRHEIARHSAQCCAASARSVSRNVTSMSSPPHISPAVRTYPRQYQYTPCSIPVYRHNSSAMQLRDMSSRRNGTYSVRAASILLQQLKQAKLSDFASARTARRQLFTRRLSLPSVNTGEVIDLTGDDDNGQDTVETCEFIFARMRRRRLRRMASVPLLHRLRQNFFRRSSQADGSCCDPKYRPTKKTFAVDKSLPFYRCFVQQLLRNYRFTASGMPVKQYPQILPPDPSRIRHASRDGQNPTNSCSYKELVANKQPVVVLEKLEKSVVNKSGTVHTETPVVVLEKLDESVVNSSGTIETIESGVPTEAATLGSEVENCVRITRSGAQHGQKLTADERTENETVQKENVTANLTENGRQCNKLVSLCRPVSVVLERLDRNKIRNICWELCKTEPCCRHDQDVSHLGTESSVDDLSWTVTRVPRPHKVPILIIRASALSARNTSQKKVAETTDVCSTRRLRSVLKCLRTRSCTELRNLLPDALEFSTSRRRIAKKMAERRKVRFQSSVLMSLRSRNYIGHTLHSQNSLSPRMPLHQMSSKSSQKWSKSSSELSAKRAADVNKTDSNLTSYPSEYNTPRKRIAKKLAQRRKLRFHSSVLTSLRSRNYIGHTLRSHSSLLARMHPDQMSLKSSRKRSKLSSELLAKRAQNNNRTDSKLTGHLHVPESLASCVKQDVHLLPSDTTPRNTQLADMLPYESVLNLELPEDCVSSDSDTVQLSPYSSCVDRDECLIPSDSNPKNTSSADLLPDASSSDNTVDLSPHSWMGVNLSVEQDMHSVPPDSFPKQASSADLLPLDAVFDDDLPEDCASSDSNTVVFSPHSSIDDQTIAYRSPLSDVMFDFDEPSLDQCERMQGSLEAGNSSRKSDVYDDEALKPPSHLDCDRVTSKLHTDTASGLTHFLSSFDGFSTTSQSLDCGMVTENVANGGKVQLTPLQLLASVNNGLHKQCAVKCSLLEFMDTEHAKCELAAASASTEIAVENSNTGPT